MAVVANNMEVISKLWDHAKEKIFDLIVYAAGVINDNGGEFITNAIIDISIIIGRIASDIFTTIAEIVRILIDLTDSIVISDVPSSDDDSHESSDNGNDDSSEGNGSNTDDSGEDGSNNDDSSGDTDGNNNGHDGGDGHDGDRIAMQVAGTVVEHGAR